MVIKADGTKAERPHRKETPIMSNTAKHTSFPFVSESYRDKTMQVKQVVNGEVKDLTEPMPADTTEEKVAAWKTHGEHLEAMNKGVIAAVPGDEPGTATLTLDGVAFATIEVSTRFNTGFGSVIIEGRMQGHNLVIPDENGKLGFDAQETTNVGISSYGSEKVDVTA